MTDCGMCGAAIPAGARFCPACGAPTADRSAHQTRRTVTVLFADMVGSTRLGERLDPEVLRAVQTRYFDALRTTIERHGGTVEKFIGDAVMAVFGIPTLHEDDAFRAIRAATDLAPAIGPLNADLERTRGLRIDLRVGVHTGEVVAADEADGSALVTGDTVNTAARLEQVAQPGEILIGPETFRLVRDAVMADRIGGLDLRGKQDAVDAYRLIAVTGAEALQRHLEAPIIGRDAELARLEAALDAAIATGKPRLVTIIAPAGVGKSRLTRRFTELVADRALILKGRCLPYGDGITYWAVAEIVRAAAGIPEGHTTEVAQTAISTLAGGGPDGRRIVSILAAILGLERTEVSGDDIAWALRRAVERLATERPVVAVVEDIHWAEPALLDLLEVTAAWSTAPLVLVCPTRPELLERRPTWPAAVTDAETIRLEPLGGENADRLIEAQPGGAALPVVLRERIAAAAEGNPLFVEEMVAKLVDDGLLRPVDGEWATARNIETVEVPLSISSLLAARVDDLETGERSVAERASVVGRSFERGAVVELAPDPDRGSIGARLLALTRKELIRPDGRGLDGDESFRFRHVLIRDAAYERLTKADRADLHERFATWLERVAADRLPEYLEIVAHHFATAAEYAEELGRLRPELAATAVARLWQASRRARSLHAHPEVVRLLRRAAALRPAAAAGPTVADLLAAAAESAGLDGSLDEAIALGEEARRAATEGEDALEVRVHVQASRWLFDRGDSAAALRELDRAESLIPSSGESPELARILAARARLLMLLNRDHDAIEIARRAASMAGDLGLPAIESSALTTLGTSQADIGDLEEGLGNLERAVRLAEEADDGFELARALTNLAWAYEVSGRVDEAIRLEVDALRAVDHLGMDRGMVGALRLNLADAYVWSGDPVRAEQLVREVIALRPEGSEGVLAQIGLAEALVGQDRLEEARPIIDGLRRGGLTDEQFIIDQIDRIVAEFDAWSDIVLARGIVAAALERDHPNTLSAYLAAFLQLGLRIEADLAADARQAGDTRALQACLDRGRAYAARNLAFMSTTVGPDGEVVHSRGRAFAAIGIAEAARMEGGASAEDWQAAVSEAIAARGGALDAYARWRLVEAMAAEGAPAAAVADAYRDACSTAERTGRPIIARQLDALGSRLPAAR